MCGSWRVGHERARHPDRFWQGITRNLNNFFLNLGEVTVQERLEGRGVPVAVLKSFTIQRQNVAPPSKVTGNVPGGILPYVIIMMCLTGAMYPALDVTAGEK